MAVERAIQLSEPMKYEQIARKMYDLKEGRSSYAKVVSSIQKANSSIAEPRANDVVVLPDVDGAVLRGGALFDEGPSDPKIPDNPKYGPIYLDETPYRVAAGTGAEADCEHKLYHGTKRSGLRSGPVVIVGQKLILTFDQASQVQESASVKAGKEAGLEVTTTIFHYTLKLYNICEQDWWQLCQRMLVDILQCKGGTRPPQTKDDGAPFWDKLPVRQWEDPVGTIAEWWAMTRREALPRAQKEMNRLRVPLEVREWPALEHSEMYYPEPLQAGGK